MSFEEQTNASEVVIDAREVAEGDYTLTLESFNTLRIAQSALKTDVIKTFYNVLNID